MFAFGLAILTALFESLKDLFSKFNLKTIDEYTAAFSMHLVQTVLLIPFLFFIELKMPSVRFMVALISAAGIQLAVILIYLKAIKVSELSVSVPLITLTPLFMLITSPIILGEFPNIYGLAGIVVIVIGTYFLSMGPKKNFWAPFQSILNNKGPRYMLIVAFLWSITANIDKIGVEETSPVFWAFTKDTLIMFILLPIMMWKSNKPFVQLRARAKTLTLVGFFRAASVLTQMYAIQFILVSYVIAIKRTSALFIIVLGYFFLKEKDFFKLRLTGVIIILAGLALILFSKS